MASGHTELLRQAREQQRKTGGSLADARLEIDRAGMDNERKNTERETQLRDLDRRFEEFGKSLRIVGPCVSGNYKTGWAVNVGNEAGAGGDDAYRQAGQMFISGQIADFVFLGAGPPVFV